MTFYDYLKLSVHHTGYLITAKLELVIVLNKKIFLAV